MVADKDGGRTGTEEGRPGTRLGAGVKGAEMGKGRWEVICVIVKGEKLYIPCRKIESDEPPVFDNYEIHRTGYLIPGEAAYVADWLNEHEESERSKHHER